MSRLIVRGLPVYLDDARLKAHFAARGHVTDVKLIRKPDGTSRRFGFVGYSSEEDARNAMEYFNRTFIDTSRIAVDIARKVDDPELVEASKRKRRPVLEGPAVPPSGPGRPKPDVLAAAALPPPKKRAKVAGSSSGAPAPATTRGGKEVTFDEFFAALAPKSKQKSYQDVNQKHLGNDLDAHEGTSQQPSSKRSKKARKASESAAPPSANSAEEAAAGQSEGAKDEEESERDEVLDDEGLTDMDYLARRMKRRIGDADAEDGDAETTSGADKTFDQSDQESTDAEDDTARPDPAIERTRQALAERAKKDEENVDALMASSRIFVRNLPFSTSSEDLEVLFGKYGEVSQVHIPLDKETKMPKGWAFITYADPTHAVTAFRALDGSTFQGRLLHLIPAVDKAGPSTSGTAAAEGASSKQKKEATLKQSKLKERKALAGKDFNWSTLYMNPDAVAASVADRLGISKSDILNPDAIADGDASKTGSSAAVRLALAETRVIQETKEFLMSHGINLDAFDARKASDPDSAKKQRAVDAERSETTMLVKNIPYGTTQDEIRTLFARHGEVDQVLLPPAGTLAIVQMSVPSEARVAFRALAYRRFKDSILYLERAPGDLFLASKTTDGKDVATSAVKGKEAPASKAALKLGGSEDATGGQAEDEDASAAKVPGATLFIKNLNFATTDAGLTAAFAPLADFAFAKIQTKPAPASAGGSARTRRDGAALVRPDGRLSMGFGFAVFKNAPAAQRAQKAMDGYLLDGHTLNVKFAKRGHDGDDEPASTTSLSKANATSTKLMIKNLPFETTKKDVRELFAAHGQVRSVRLPKRIDNRPRGFAFVEFVSHREAEAAKDALRHTRLLGRHLVINWAEEEGGGSSGGGGAGLDVVERQQAKEAILHGGGSVDSSLRGKKGKLRMNESDIADAVAAEKKRRAEADDDEDEEDD